MAYLRKHAKSGKVYYAVVYAIRLEGQPHPVQRQLAWLGDAEQAITKLEAGIPKVSPTDHEKMLGQLRFVKSPTG